MGFLYFVAKLVMSIFKLSKKLVGGIAKKQGKGIFNRILKYGRSTDEDEERNKGLIDIALEILLRNGKRIVEFLIFMGSSAFFIGLIVIGVSFLSVLTKNYDFDYQLGFEDLKNERDGIITSDTVQNKDLIHEALYSRVSDLSYYQAFNQIDKNRGVVEDIRLWFGKDAGKSFFYWINWDDLRIKDANNIDVADLKPATGVEADDKLEKGNEYFRDYYGREEEFLISQDLLKEMNNALFENYNQYINESLKFPEAFIKPIHFIFDFNRVVLNEETGEYEDEHYVAKRDKEGKVIETNKPSKIVYDYAVADYNDMDYHYQFFSDNTSYYAVANKNPIKYLTKPEFSEEMRDLEIHRGNLDWNREFDYSYKAPTRLKEVAYENLDKDDKIRRYRKPGLSPANAIPEGNSADRKRTEEDGVVNVKIEDKDKAILMVVEKAQSLVGSKYAYGSEDSGLAMGNIGFLKQVFEEIKVPVGPSPTNILLDFGIGVPANEPLQAGDLAVVSVDKEGKNRHVLMYLGDEKWIHTTPELGQVTIQSHEEVKDLVEDKLLGVKRVITSKEEGDVTLIKEGFEKNYEASAEDGGKILVKKEPKEAHLKDIYRRDYGADHIRSEKIVKLYYVLDDSVKYGTDINRKGQVKGPYETVEDALNDTNILKIEKNAVTVGDPDDPNPEEDDDRENAYVLSTGEKIPVYPNRYPKRYYQKVPLTDDKGNVTAKSIPLINTKEAKTKKLKESFINSEEYMEGLEEFAEKHKLSIKVKSLKRFEGVQFSYLLHGKEKTLENEAIDQYEEYLLKNGDQGYHWEWSKDGSVNVPIAKTRWFKSEEGYLNLKPWKLEEKHFDEFVTGKDSKPMKSDAAKRENGKYYDFNNSDREENETFSNLDFYWDTSKNWPVDKTFRKPLPIEIESVRDWGLGSILSYLEDRVAYFNTGLFTDDTFQSKQVSSNLYERNTYNKKDLEEGWFPYEYIEKVEGFEEEVATNGASNEALLNWRVENIYNKMDDNYKGTKHKKRKLVVPLPVPEEDEEDTSVDTVEDEEFEKEQWNKVVNGITVYEKENRFIDKDTHYFGPYYKSKWRYFTRINRNAQFLSPIKFHLKWHDNKNKYKELIDQETGDTIRIPNAIIDEENMAAKDPDVGSFLDLDKNKFDWDNNGKGTGKRQINTLFGEVWEKNKEQFKEDIGTDQDFDYTKDEWLEGIFVIDQAVTFAADFLLTYEKVVERIAPVSERRIVDGYVAGRHANIVGWKHVEINSDGSTTSWVTPDDIRIYRKDALNINGAAWDKEELEDMFRDYQGFHVKEGSGALGIGNPSRIKVKFSGDKTYPIIEENYGKAFPLYRTYKGWRKKIYPRHIATYMNNEEFERWKERTDPIFKDNEEIQAVLNERDKYFKYIEDYMRFFEANVPYNAKDELSLKRDANSKFKRIYPGGPKSTGTFTEQYLQNFINEGNKPYWKDLFNELGINTEDMDSDTMGRVLQGIAEVERQRSWTTFKGYYKDKGIEIEDADNKEDYMNMDMKKNTISIASKEGEKELDLIGVGIMTLPKLPPNSNGSISTTGYGESFEGIKDVSLSTGNKEERIDMNESIHFAGIKLAKLSKKYNSIPVGIYAYLVGENLVDNVLDEITKLNDKGDNALSWKKPSDKAIKDAISKTVGSNLASGNNNFSLFSPDLVTEVLGYVNGEGLENGQTIANSISAGEESGIPMEINPNADPSSFSYMAYTAIKSKTSEQWKINYEDERVYTDSQGLRRRRKGDAEDEQNDDFMLAMGQYYGKVWDRFKLELDNGTVFTAILGDSKAKQDTDPSMQYHLVDGSMIEFIVDRSVYSGASNIRNGTNYSWNTSFFNGKLIAIEKLSGDPPKGGNGGSAGGYTRVTNGEELKEKMDILIGRDYQALRTQSAGTTGLKGSGVDYVVNHMPISEVQNILYKAGLARREEEFSLLEPSQYFDVLDLLGNPNSLFYRTKAQNKKVMGGNSSAATLEELSEFIFNTDEYVYPLDPRPGAVKTPISSKFGYRTHPVLKEWKLHNGLDIPVPVGTTLYAIAPGKVISAGKSGSAGNMLVIAIPIDEAGEHHIVTVYMHMDRIDVRQGDMVEAGEIVGATGNTGRSTGPHLHMEVRLQHGEYRAPQEMIDRYGVVTGSGTIVMNPFAFAVQDPTEEQIQYAVNGVNMK